MDLKVMVVMVVVAGVEASPPLHPIPPPQPHLPNHLDPTTCPPTYEEHPLLLISMDGFRAEYLRRGITPTLSRLRNEGVTAPYMKPSYPTITFPNHYTIVTGLYPAAHGIIENAMYDPGFDAIFRPGREEFFKKRWWGGEPIWTTVQKKGKRSATFFWPGSEVEGQYPDYWYYYNESIPFPHRVDQVLSWLDLPLEQRPSFITLYFHEPDSTGHDFGPHSPQMNAMLVEMDGVINQLIQGLITRRLLPCVNLIIIADHGMEEAGEHRLIDLSNYLPNLSEQARFWGGGFARFTPHDATPDNKEAMMRALACKREEMRVYERELLPVRWHLGSQVRMEDIIVEVDPGYTLGDDSTFEADNGEHGYDDHFPSMNAIFLGYGPDLARSKDVEVFQNIELYNLMCYLLGVTPAPNNGTWGALHHLLADIPLPPAFPPLPPRPPSPKMSIPEGVEDSGALFMSQCEGDAEGAMQWLELLKKAQKEEEQLIRYHAPFGTPQGYERDTVLLLQPDSLTAYSKKIRLPLWSSFGVSRVKERKEGRKEWRSDPRLRMQDSPHCPSYRTVKGLNVTRQPLFPPEFSCGECKDLPFLMSNALPLTNQLAERLTELTSRLAAWSLHYGPINVVAGPAMDYNADSLADNMDEIGNEGELVVPSHIFFVVSRCVAPVLSLSDCPHNKIDTEAFILPQFIPVPNCLSPAKFLQEYSAKVSDVEGLTGLKFFPDVGYYERVRLRTRMHSNIWGHERVPSKTFY